MLTRAPLLLLFLLASTAHAAPRTVGYLPLVVDNGAEESAGRVDSKLRDELRRLPGVQLKALERGSCATGDAACLVRLGQAAAVQAVVSPALQGDAEGYALTLSIVDVAAGTEAGATTIRLDKDPATHAMKVREIVTRVLAPDLYVGQLLLSVSKPGARVLIDGVEVGTTPLAGPIEGLAPGRHALEVRLEGHKTVSRFVDVTFSEVTSDAVELVPGEGIVDETAGDIAVEVPVEQPPTTSGLGTPLLATGAGLAGGGVLLLAGAGAMYFLALENGGVPAGANPEDSLAVLERARLFSGLAYGLGVAGVVAVLGGGALLATPLVME